MVRVDRLRVLRDYLAELSTDKFNIGRWYARCGTVACIAGHAALIPEFQACGLEPDLINNVIRYQVAPADRPNAIEYMRDVMQTFRGVDRVFKDGFAVNLFLEMPQPYTNIWYCSFYADRELVPEDDDEAVTLPMVLSVLDEIIHRYEGDWDAYRPTTTVT